MKSFIKLSNQIFSYRLSPRAFYLYSYLLSRVNCFGSVSLTYAALSSACRLDPKTIRTALTELEDKSLVRKQNRYNEIGYRANRYHVQLPPAGKGWFPVEREVFQTSIRPTDFVVYCFIRKCMSAGVSEAFPSLSAISRGTGISRGRVAQAVTFLRSFTYINRVRRRYRRTRAYRHNRYLPFRFPKTGKKRKAHAKAHAKLFSKNKITLFQDKVKGFLKSLQKGCCSFFLRGSPYFPQHV